MNETIIELLADFSKSLSHEVLELELHLKVSDGEVQSRRLWLLLKPDDDHALVSVQYSPSIPRMLEEQVVQHAGDFGGFVGIARNGNVTFAASYQHHSKPKVQRFGN